MVVGLAYAPRVTWMPRVRGLVVAALTMTVLAGCGLPAGIDGDLTGDWAAMPEPTVFVPRAEVCHAQGYQSAASVAEYQPIRCDVPHVSETVHVGEFTGSAAERDSPPRPGSSAWRRAYRQCDKAAAEYLGADFRHARLWLGVTVPVPEAWEGGARWFRCEVLAVDEEARVDERRVGSLKGALTEDRSLWLGCYRADVEDDTDVVRMTPVGCDEPHHAEYVGVWEAPDGDYPEDTDDAAADRVHQGCLEQVATYVGLPVDADLPSRVGTIADWMGPEDWANGDRKFRCYLWANGDELERSLEGQGVDALPVR